MFIEHMHDNLLRS